MLTVKFSPEGVQQWSRLYYNLSRDKGSDVSSMVAVDAKGDTFVVGRSARNYGTELVLLKYSPSGDWVWETSQQPECKNWPFLPSIALGSDGGIFVAGEVSDAFGEMECVTGTYPEEIRTIGGTDAFVTKFDRNGCLLWTTNFGADFVASERFEKVAVDDQGAVIATGIQETCGLLQIITAKYESVDVPGAPVILEPPRSQFITADGKATFNVVAAGAEPLEYQWTLDGIGVLGLTNSSLVFDGVQPQHTSSKYVVTVRNAYGSARSPAVKLQVLPRFLSIQRATNGVASFWFVGEAIARYEVQASSDLVHWTPLFRLKTMAPEYRSDPTATNQPCRFYRAVRY